MLWAGNSETWSEYAEGGLPWGSPRIIGHRGSGPAIAFSQSGLLCGWSFAMYFGLNWNTSSAPCISFIENLGVILPLWPIRRRWCNNRLSESYRVEKATTG